MRPQGRTVDEIVASIAARHHGNVTPTQLLGAGVTQRQIRTRVASGALIRQFRGVYRVGHASPSTHATYMGAVLACGDGALLAGRAAAHLLQLCRGRRAPKPEVLTLTERRIEGIVTRRARQPSPHDRIVCDGIPTTSVPRTLVDLAAELSAEQLAAACHEAGVRFKTTPRHIDSALARRPNAAGSARLRSVLRGDTRATLSVLERRFLDLLRRESLPLPETNRPAGGRRVDCRWPEHGLTVELDSYRYHGSRHAWERDRRREREAYARGDEFRRFTYDDVMVDSRQLLAELRPLLATRRPQGPN